MLKLNYMILGFGLGQVLVAALIMCVEPQRSVLGNVITGAVLLTIGTVMTIFRYAEAE